MDDPLLLQRGMREGGWDERSIRTLAARLSSAAETALPRATLVQEIREALGTRTRVVERTWTETVEVPLYRFGAPPVPGSKVEYSEGDTVSANSGWKVRFFGVGTGRTASVELSKSCTFVATAGTWKQVFVPVLVEVSVVALYENGVFAGRGHEASVVAPAGAGDLLNKRGIRSVPRDQQHGRGSDTPHHTLDLALTGDTSGDVQKEKRVWVKDVGREVSLELGKLVDVSAVVKVRRTRRLELSFELPSGHHYVADLCNGYMRWVSPTGAAPRRRRPRKRLGDDASVE